ncbi:MAG TPA: GNAT family N-acetyltransferase [Brevefilum sp.]
MDKKINIKYREEPAWEVIGGGITAYNTEKAGDDHGKNLCFVLEDSDREILGGVIGMTYWNWLYISLMWLPEGLRGQGYGSQLLEMAEDEGRKRGAEYAYLDTFSFQAPGFYKKLGYQLFGKLEEFPPGHSRCFLKKRL